VDASVECRDRPEQFRERVGRLVARANKQRPAGLVMPHPDSNPDERRARVEQYRRAHDEAAAASLEAMDEMAYDEPDPEDAATTPDSVPIEVEVEGKGKGRCPDDDDDAIEKHETTETNQKATTAPATTTTTTTATTPGTKAKTKTKRQKHNNKCCFM
jgi:hypothetical protein